MQIKDTNYNPPARTPRYGIFFSHPFGYAARSSDYEDEYAYDEALRLLATQCPSTLWVGRFVRQLPEDGLEEIRYDYFYCSARTSVYRGRIRAAQSAVRELYDQYEARGEHPWAADRRALAVLREAGIQ